MLLISLNTRNGAYLCNDKSVVRPNHQSFKKSYLHTYPMVKVWRESGLSRVWQGRVLDKQSNRGTLGFFWDKEEQDVGKT